MGRRRKNLLAVGLQSEVAPPSTPVSTISQLPRYKIMLIEDRQLQDILNAEEALGYEPLMFLKTILPSMYDDNKRFKVLFKKKEI